MCPGGITLQSISAYQYGNTGYKADLSRHRGAVPGRAAFLVCHDSGIIRPTASLLRQCRRSHLVGRIHRQIAGQGPLHVDFRRVRAIRPVLLPHAGLQGFRDQYSCRPALRRMRRMYYDLSGNNPTTDLSGFGQVALNLPAGFQIAVGGRYSHTTTKNSGVYIHQFGTVLLDDQKAGSNNVSYKVALNWNVDDDNYLYAFVATGFKPGGLNVPVGFGIPAPFVAETVTDYEAGVEVELLRQSSAHPARRLLRPLQQIPGLIGYPAFPTFGFEVNDPNVTKLYGVEGEAQAVFGDLSFDTQRWPGAQPARNFLCNGPARGEPSAVLQSGDGPARAAVLRQSGRTRADLRAELHVQCRRVVQLQSRRRRRADAAG